MKDISLHAVTITTLVLAVFPESLGMRTVFAFVFGVCLYQLRKEYKEDK